MRRTTSTLLALLAAATFALSGCTDPADKPTEPEPPAETPTGTTTPAQEQSVTMTDAWVRATEAPMTGVFGTLTSTAEEDLVLVAATSASAGFVELHEVVGDETGERVMQEKDGGFVVPAGGTHVLEPGADHIMLMDLDQALEPGQDVVLILTFDDGTSIEVTAQVRSSAAEEEDYVGGHGHGADEDAMPSGEDAQG
ncbi:copper chaperone PCu(A)C [Cellulomonas bogoriensis]|uniref:Copper chaperone PCu(A)C n=1 Tax=Cellulomonas bogoriensis 69B4 = DSM 16987 TaxID=1386082 RepID=A0A0A0BP59_9CELL|nr:copper chaperone PCu(A)C [Cellulomonas bogoriensis]KGM09482.1 hypothetical protein N869_06990 [Cellulomonas bogoriensis 69B4 = DSM 16987]